MGFNFPKLQDGDGGDGARSNGDGDGVIGAVGDFARNAAEALGPTAQSAWDWLVNEGPEQAVAAAIAIGLFLVLRFLRAFLCGVLRSRKKPDNAPRNVASALIGGTWSLFLFLLALVIVEPFTSGLPEAGVDGLHTTFMIVSVLQFAVWLRLLVTGVSSGYLRAQGAEGGPGSTAATLIRTLSGIVIWAVAIAMILTNLGYDIGPVLAGIGVGGLAIGLALQNVFKDLFSSLSIIFDKPFQRGDFIKFGGGEYQGEVEKIGMKSTRIRSLTGEQIVVGNSQILDKEVRNFQRMDARRAQFDLGVVYQTSHDQLRNIPSLVETAVASVDGVDFDRCRFKAFGSSALIFDVAFWVRDRDYKVFLERQEQALFNIHRNFEQAGLSFAYPTQTVHVEGRGASF